MKFIDLRDDKDTPAFRVAITHFAEGPSGAWLTTGAVEVFDVGSMEQAESIARGCSGKGRTIQISHDGAKFGHFNLHSPRLSRS